MKATLFSSSISANLGNSGIHKYILGQAMKKRPTGHYKKYSHFKYLIHQLREKENTVAVAKIPGPAGRGARRTRAILSRDRTEDDEKFVQRCQSNEQCT